MTVSTISRRAFNQDTGAAKRAANDGPVFITDRGSPACVLPSTAEYRRLCGDPASVADALGMPGGAAIDFDPPRLRGPLSLPADLS